jgi:hypothetical protein
MTHKNVKKLFKNISIYINSEEGRMYIMPKEAQRLKEIYFHYIDFGSISREDIKYLLDFIHLNRKGRSSTVPLKNV